MKAGFRQRMAEVHTWMGLLLGWVLYFMFITGTAGYLDTEIDRWMQPEAPVADYSVSPQTVVEHGRNWLDIHAPGASRWFIRLPVDRNDPYPRVFWQGAQGEGIAANGNAFLDPATGQPVEARATGGGQLLYQMHWRLHYLPRVASDWIIGVATMFMLVALVTGIIVHKKIFKDFFTFRPGKGQRSWLDMHNVVSVISLPFQLMITYSGLIFMALIYMPLIVVLGYGSGADNRQTFIGEAFGVPPMVEAMGVPAPLASLDAVLDQVSGRWGDAPVGSFEIRHPNDANARILVRGSHAAGPLRAANMLEFDGVSGELLAEYPARQSGSKAFRDVMLGLHEGLFAGPLLRALYVFSGLLGAAMIATGLMLWTVKRRQRAEKARGGSHIGLRLVERLNIGIVIGLPVAIAAYFWANRLLPVGFSARAEWEVHAMFLLWVVFWSSRSGHGLSSNR
ncbi:hypothetical protein CKO35_16800 [Ectothiorhodospira shaposhnikovii]|uniref:PepSY-associated TM helix domain-containing protein n=1 Tax=Ectothiorhodospira shaposhnikovii TaxID=1054 RepID=UPI0019053BE1|nr:PepSY-associated TM helix domain-containing protein [Ectothiorhodospira shaposhnikovii]MBK1674914.1 hypothetical protein [Ectothiorhodospira shaposhnikovii]